MNEQNNQKPKFKYSYLFLLLVALLLIILIFTNTGYSGEYIGSVSQVEQLVNGTYVNEVTKETEQLQAVYYKNGKIYFLIEGSRYENAFPDYSDYYMNYEAGDGVLQKVLQFIDNYNEGKTEEEKISYIKGVDGVNFWDIIYPILYLGFGIFMIWMIFRLINSSNKGAMSFGKSKARSYANNPVKFSDVAGTEEEKEELAEIVEFLKNPSKFTQLGARIPKGVLLVGPPGTGKTLLARAVAGEANVPFVFISGSDFVEMFVGVGASRVRDLFDQAKKNKPCIVFIDEIDAVGRQRGAGLGGGNDEREQTLNQLLVEMDGFQPNEGIIVLAATNRSDVLDPALLRPGRFDRQIYVNIPDVKGREGILKIHARNKPIDENVDFKTLAKITVGFTGADIENMLNEAAILAARANRPKITMTDIQEGINKVTMGPQKKSRVVTEKDRKITAYHESGHAILGKLLEHTDEIQEVSIIPRGMAGGYTMQRPENDNSFISYNHLMDEIAMCMGGRIAEEIVFKDITTGASSDINQATKLAHKMIHNWGMSKNLGFLGLETNQQVFIGRDYQTRSDFSEKLAAEADDEMRQILDYNYKRAKKILLDNKKLLDEMASLLLSHETINKDEVDLLIQGKTADEVAQIMDQKDADQKRKEEETRKQMEKERKAKAIEEKLREGEKLLASGIITQEEYEKIKKAYLIDKNDFEQNTVKPSISDKAKTLDKEIKDKGNIEEEKVSSKKTTKKIAEEEKEAKSKKLSSKKEKQNTTDEKKKK